MVVALYAILEYSVSPTRILRQYRLWGCGGEARVCIIHAAMPQRQKINLAKVNAALNTSCPKCGHLIAPAELRRIDFERVECPKCGERFVPGSRNVRQD